MKTRSPQPTAPTPGAPGHGSRATQVPQPKSQSQSQPKSQSRPQPHQTVPTALLLDPRLTPSAKLLWLCVGADRLPGLQDLEARSGLTRKTIRHGLTQLTATAWLPRPSRQGPAVPLPTALVQEPHLRPAEKLLYGILQLTPGFVHPEGQFTHAELGALAGLSKNTIKQAVQRLQATGWLRTARRNRRSPIGFALRNPLADRADAVILAIRQRLEEAMFKGEALMREYLSLLIDSDEFDDNASPGFLVNPYTGEELQFDRYYPPNVAFEFNGPQHYGPTQRYANESQVARQQGRDLIKLGICVTRGIRLVVIHPADLATDALRDKINGLLPLRDLPQNQPVLHFLDGLSRAYRKRAPR